MVRDFGWVLEGSNLSPSSTKCSVAELPGQEPRPGVVTGDLFAYESCCRSARTRWWERGLYRPYPHASALAGFHYLPHLFWFGGHLPPL